MVEYGAQAGRAATISPDDNSDIPTTIGIYVGTSGDLKVDMADGSTVTLVGLAAGVCHPIRVRRVYEAGTDADDIVGLYPDPA